MVAFSSLLIKKTKERKKKLKINRRSSFLSSLSPFTVSIPSRGGDRRRSGGSASRRREAPVLWRTGMPVGSSETAVKDRDRTESPSDRSGGGAWCEQRRRRGARWWLVRVDWRQQ